MQQTFGNNLMKTHNVRVEFCRHNNFGTSRRVTANLQSKFLILSSEEATRARVCLIVLDDFSLHPDYSEASFILKSGGCDIKFAKQLFVGKVFQIRFTFPTATIRHNWQHHLLSIPRKKIRFKQEHVPNRKCTASLETICWFIDQNWQGQNHMGSLLVNEYGQQCCDRYRVEIETYMRERTSADLEKNGADLDEGKAMLRILQEKQDTLQAQRATIDTILKRTPENRHPEAKLFIDGQLTPPNRRPKSKSVRNHGQLFSPMNRSKRTPTNRHRKSKSCMVTPPHRHYAGSRYFRSGSTTALTPTSNLDPIIEANLDAMDTRTPSAAVDARQPPFTPNLAASLEQKVHDSADTESKTYEESKQSKTDANKSFAGDIWSFAGDIQKRGDKLPVYRRRYAEIRGNSELVYYLSRGDCPHNPRARASLVGGKLTMQQFANRFQITLVNGTKFSFQTSAATYNQWVAHIMRAIRV